MNRLFGALAPTLGHLAELAAFFGNQRLPAGDGLRGKEYSEQVEAAGAVIVLIESHQAWPVDDEHVEFKPKRSRRAVYALLEAIARINSGLNADRVVGKSGKTLNDVLHSTARLAHHDHLVVVMSDFAGIDNDTHRYLSRIAKHNDLILMHVHDPAAVGLQSNTKAVLGDSTQQAEIDLSSAATKAAIQEFNDQRLKTIMTWQTEINLSVVPLSAGEETLPQIRRLLASAAPQRRIR